jgi:hypothetical protein
MPGENKSEEPGTVSSTDIAKQTAGEDSGKESGTVKLADIANQCKNYTQTGFNYYAESIKGAFFAGNAKIDTIGSTPSKLGTHLIRLINKKFGTAIFLTLQGVPKEVAIGLKEGRDFGITGIVEHSQMTDSNCDVILTYRSTK